MSVNFYATSCAFASVASLCRPTAVDRQDRASDRRRGVAGEERRKRGYFIDRNELLGRLRVEQYIFDHVIFGDAPGLCRIGNLLLHERRPDIARTDRVHGDAVL